MTTIQDTLTQISNDTAKVQAEKAKTRMGQSTLDQDAFLQLMMAQLKSQDPLSPMDTNDFLSQQAQFTQVSELQKLNSAMSSSNQMMQASSLIGKEVTLTDPDDSKKTISGVVSEAKISSKGAGIVINDKQYSMDSIISIK